MVQAGLISLDLSKGTHHLSISAAQKNLLLCKIVSFKSEISKDIKETQLLYKIKKRNEQQNYRDNRQMRDLIQPRLKIQCFNTGPVMGNSIPQHHVWKCNRSSLSNFVVRFT